MLTCSGCRSGVGRRTGRDVLRDLRAHVPRRRAMPQGRWPARSHPSPRPARRQGARRALHDGRAPRPGWDGGDLPCRAAIVRSRRRGQGDERRCRREPGSDQAVLARGEAGEPAHPPQRRHRARLRRDRRRHLLHRHGARRRANALRHPRAGEEAVGRAHRPHRDADLRSARQRARAVDRSPRPQAHQHHGADARPRPREDPRLRPREVAVAGDRTDDDRARRDARHAGVHAARARQRPAVRLASRPVLARLHPLPVRHRRAAVPVRVGERADRDARHRQGAGDDRGAAEARADHRSAAREVAR